MDDPNGCHQPFQHRRSRGRDRLRCARGKRECDGTRSLVRDHDTGNRGAKSFGAVTKLAVTWSAPATDSTHGAATGYNLRYGPSGSGSWTTLAGVSSPATIAGLIGGTAYDVQVQASNAALNPSAWSASTTASTWGATVAAGGWVPASIQTHGAAIAPNGGANLIAVAAPTAVTGGAFAWSASNTAVPTSGLVAGGADGVTNGWGQWFNAPATAGTYYLWLLAQAGGGVTSGALVTGPIVVS